MSPELQRYVESDVRVTHELTQRLAALHRQMVDNTSIAWFEAHTDQWRLEGSEVVFLKGGAS